MGMPRLSLCVRTVAGLCACLEISSLENKICLIASFPTHFYGLCCFLAYLHTSMALFFCKLLFKKKFMSNPAWTKGGKSGNPNGRPLGGHNKGYGYLQRMLEAAPEIIEQVIQKAKEGDKDFIKLCVDKIVPRVKGYAINIGIADDKKHDLEYLLNYNYNLIQQVAHGEVLGDDVKPLSDLISNQVALIEKVKLEKQLDEITAELEKQKKNESSL